MKILFCLIPYILFLLIEIFEDNRQIKKGKDVFQSTDITENVKSMYGYVRLQNIYYIKKYVMIKKINGLNYMRI